MNTRTGKIARLPKTIREELNRLLEDGRTGPKLLEWLNSLPVTLIVARASRPCERELPGETLVPPLKRKRPAAARVCND